MPIKINYGTCDNSAECFGISVCPTGALYWDDTKENSLGEKGMLCADNSKCISCGKCVGDEGCPVGAIFYANTDVELRDLIDNYEEVKHLFVERYGAPPIDESLCVDSIELKQIISKNKGILLVEEYTDSSIQCLLSSIPVKTIIHEVQTITGASNIQFYRTDLSSTVSENATLPILKIYNLSKFIGEIEGYYSNSQLNEFKSLLQEIFR